MNIDRNKLRHLIDFLAKRIDYIGESFHGTKVTIQQKALVDIFLRIRCNLAGISVMLSTWPEAMTMKIPISLAFRAIVTDDLTALYLLTLACDKQTFINELLLLNRSYIKSVNVMIEHLHFDKPYLSEPELESEKNGYINNLYRNADQQLFRSGTNELKNPGELRASSNPALFHDQTKLRSSLTEDFMFEQVKNNQHLSNLGYLYILNRYFSQYQHYSVAGTPMFTFPPQHEFRQWIIATTLTYDSIGTISKVIGVDSQIIDGLNQEGQLFRTFFS